MTGETSSHGCGHGQKRENAVAAGVIIMAVGITLLVERALHLQGQIISRLWPLLMVILGAVRLGPATPTREGRRRRRGGAWLIYLGCWGLVSEFHVFGFTFATSWPLLIIGAGLLTVWGALEEAAAPSRES